MEIDSAARVLVETVNALAVRAPAIIAAAAKQLKGITLGLHFGDGSHAVLRAQHSRLLAATTRARQPTVEVYFDDRSLNVLFDLEHRPIDELAAGSLDVRGERANVLATWRCFKLLSQRGSGLRAVQAIWRSWRDRAPRKWGAPARYAKKPKERPALSAPRATGWQALDYLDQRHPADGELHDASTGALSPSSRCLWDGRGATDWADVREVFDNDLLETLQICRARVAREIMRILPKREPKAELYDLMRDYPMRDGKGLRPTLTMASCMAFGGSSEDAVRTAAAIELFHNGFLIHDDIADESTHRRGKLTLHGENGIGLAVNTGDAMNLFAVDAVLSNLPT